MEDSPSPESEQVRQREIERKRKAFEWLLFQVHGGEVPDFRNPENVEAVNRSVSRVLHYMNSERLSD